jgi:hypothetical protein
MRAAYTTPLSRFMHAKSANWTSAIAGAPFASRWLLNGKRRHSTRPISSRNGKN